MLWPNLNGTNLAFQGGYHYMKLEGKYIDDEGNEQFYNNHTGPTNGVDLSFEQLIFYNINSFVEVFFAPANFQRLFQQIFIV